MKAIIIWPNGQPKEIQGVTQTPGCKQTRLFAKLSREAVASGGISMLIAETYTSHAYTAASAVLNTLTR